MTDNITRGRGEWGGEFGVLSWHRKPRGVTGALVNCACQHPSLMGWKYSTHQRPPTPSWDRAMG